MPQINPIIAYTPPYYQSYILPWARRYRAATRNRWKGVTAQG